MGNGHLVIDRKRWGAAHIPNELSKNLEHPIPYVIITHIGVQSRPCDNLYNCSIKMRTIQDSAIAEKKWNDLPANFYVSFPVQSDRRSDNLQVYMRATFIESS